MRNFNNLRIDDLQEIIIHQDAELVKLKETLKTARDIAYDSPELNMENYSHGDVGLLNNAMCEVFDILESA